MAVWIWLAACGGDGEGKDPPPRTDPTETEPTTEPTTPIEAACVDAAPANATSTVVSALVPEGEAPPVCEWTCDAPWEREGDGCVLRAACGLGWCFDNPTPQSGAVLAGWSGDGETWFSTWSSMLWRQTGDGPLEEVVQPGFNSAAIGIFGRWDDLWVVSVSRLLRWDGTVLADATPPGVVLDLYDVAAWDATHAWVVGGAQEVALGGALYTFDGTALALATDGVGRDPFVAVSMSGPETGFVASSVQVYRVDGTGFFELPGYPGTDVQDVAARGDEVVVTDWYSGVFRWDGASWTRLRPQPVSSLWTDGATVYAAGESVLRLDGTTFVEVDVGAPFAASALWGEGVLQGVGGVDGELATLGPSGWTALAGGVRVDWTVAAAASSDEIWVAGWSEQMLRWDGAAWQPETMPAVPALSGVMGLYAPGGEELWLASYDGLWQRASDGAWDRRGPMAAFGGVDGLASDDLWAVTLDGEAMHFSPSGLVSEFPGIGSLGLVHVAGPEDVWVGNDWVGDLARWDGSTWTAARTRRPWVGLDSTGPDDVWALTEDGEVWHWDGATFARQNRWFLLNFTDLVAVAPDDVWALTGGTYAFHWDGVDWTRHTVPANVTTATRRGDETLLLGENGTILFPEP
jgi:hypothetical protein